jgi:hypothetical protein
MEEFFHKHIIKFTIIVTLPLWVAWAMADEIVGYTEHGIPVTQKELEVRTINFDRIRTWEWNNKTNTLRLEFSKNKKVDVLFFNRCWDMEYATGLQFRSWADTRFVGKGDSITPISWTNQRALYPCTIKSMTAVLPEEVANND